MHTLSEQYTAEREAIGGARHEITKAIGAARAAQALLRPVYGLADTTGLERRLLGIEQDLDALMSERGLNP